MNHKQILLKMFLNEPKLILLYTVKWFQVLLCLTNNLIKYQSFVYIQLNDQTVLFLTIQFSRNHLFTLSLDVKQFYLIPRLDPTKCYHFGSEWTLEVMAMKGYSAFPKAPSLREPHDQIV